MFNALLTANPMLWPRHAWVNLPLIPFSLITLCTPFLWTTHSLVHLVLWITPSFVPLLSPWPTSPLVVPDVAAARDTLRPIHPASLRMWPPPPALVCVLFPYVRMLYEHFRTRVTLALVRSQVHPPPPLVVYSGYGTALETAHAPHWASEALTVTVRALQTSMSSPEATMTVWVGLAPRYSIDSLK